ncbi:microsomal glutathione S-transferase 1-like [Amphiura filiformis]|uniref:microsomal glutathione S-transferase 1-like n=1 Tax=Amphiura filiformis TaxID=82378 RepID=UPI003B21E503
MENLSFENEIFRLFAQYGTLVVVKMMSLSFITAYKRITRKTFIVAEDAAGAKDPQKHVRIDPDIERVRQCHRNDMENIPPFLIIGLFYVLTSPSLFAATWHFRVFAISRFCHMIAYLIPLPQPTRALSFFVGAFTTLSMAVQVLKLATL